MTDGSSLVHHEADRWCFAPGGSWRKMLACGRWLIRKRSVGSGVTWPWWGLRTVFGIADSPERLLKLSANWKKMSRGMPNLSRLQRQAHHSFQQGELDRAERLCAGILAHRPDDFDALHLLGMLHFQRHRLVDALRFLARALKVNSSSADALSNSGWRSMRPGVTTKPSRATAMRWIWRRTIRKFSIISATRISRSITPTMRCRITITCWRLRRVTLALSSTGATRCCD